MQKTLAAAAALALAAGAAPAASAAPLQIQFAGANYEYIDGAVDGLCDADTPICGTRNGVADFSDADSLNSMDFVVGGSLVGQLNAGSDLGLDFMLPGLDGLAPGDNLAGSGGYLDLYMFGDWGLALNLDAWIVNFDDAGALTITGGGSVADVQAQNLPFGLILEGPVTFSFSGNNVAFTNLGFTAAGTGEVTGVAAVPEPATLLLIGSGLCAGALRLRRQRRA